MNNILRTLLVLSALSILGACTNDRLPPASTQPTTDQSTTAGANPNGVANVNANGTDLAPVPSTLQRSVYFDFDSYSVKDQYRPVVEANARYLQAHKERRVLIQGNTDERGGSEYNLALGQKRAEAVRSALATLGVPDSQMEAVSFGKEKPKALGHDETAWAENRRVDIVYQ